MWPALISAGASLLGGLINSSSSRSNNAANLQQQLSFAQNGVSWRAQDATRAQNETGINRLALLGVPTNSFSNLVGDSSLGDSIGRAGQDIGRAVAAGVDQPSREQQLNEKLLEAKIANVNADTVRMQAAASDMVRRMGQPGTPPGVPIPRPNPLTVNWDKYNAKPLTQLFADGRGGFVEAPSADASQSFQNWASMPAQVAVASGLAGWNVGNAWDALGGWGVVPGAVGRAASGAQWSTYPWN